VNDTYFHLAAFSGSLTNGSTNAAVAVVNDGVLTPSGTTQFLLPYPAQLRLAYSAGANITNARINTPSLRYVGLPSVGPLNLTLTVPSPPNVADFGQMGPTLPTADGISVEHSLGGAAPEQEMTALWLMNRFVPRPSGPTYRLRFTGTIAAVANTWVNGSMTPDQTLPAGRYAIVGLDAVGTNLVLVRLLFPGTKWRPGCLARNAVGNVSAPQFTNGDLGLYGVFDSVNVPNFDILSTGANAAQTVFMDVVRIGDRLGQAA
jgi:hypothetical protein